MVAQEKRLHLGCGHNTPEGWINLDGSWNAWIAKHPILRKLLKVFHIIPLNRLNIHWNPDILIHDLRKPLPFQADSVSVIYASHLIEHLYLDEGKRLLNDCYRILKPGGILRMVVPDLRAIIKEYMGENPFGDALASDETMSADRLNKRLLLRSPEPLSGNIIYRLYTVLKDLHLHKWMYDSDSLVEYFKCAGFVDVQGMEYHKSRIEGIEKIEESERVLNGSGVCVEGIKPTSIA